MTVLGRPFHGIFDPQPANAVQVTICLANAELFSALDQKGHLVGSAVSARKIRHDHHLLGKCRAIATHRPLKNLNILQIHR